jgi:hypothetical protein
MKYTKKLKRSRLVVISLLIALFVSACATVFTGTSQMIQINSNVHGAEVFINGAPVGRTPFQGMIKKSNDSPSIVIRASGYHDATVLLNSEINYLIFLNWLGIYCSTTSTSIDFLSKAAWRYSPNTYYVNLFETHARHGEIEELKIGHFSMMNHSNIALEANKNEGEHFDVLVNLLQNNMDRETAIESVQVAIEKSEGNQLIFRNELISSFRTLD